MSRKKNFFKFMVGETPIAPDLFWGMLSVIIYSLAELLFEITNWLWWLILAAGMNGILFIIEAMRFRTPLLPKYRSARRLALGFICVFLFACIVPLIKRMFIER